MAQDVTNGVKNGINDMTGNGTANVPDNTVESNFGVDSKNAGGNTTANY